MGSLNSAGNRPLQTVTPRLRERLPSNLHKMKKKTHILHLIKKISYSTNPTAQRHKIVLTIMHARIILNDTILKLKINTKTTSIRLKRERSAAIISSLLDWNLTKSSCKSKWLVGPEFILDSCFWIRFLVQFVCELRASRLLAALVQLSIVFKRNTFIWIWPCSKRAASLYKHTFFYAFYYILCDPAKAIWCMNAGTCSEMLLRESDNVAQVHRSPKRF